MKALIKNENIQIIYTEKNDIPFVIETEQENSMYVGQWTFSQHETAINDNDVLHLIIKNKDGVNIGYIILKGIENQNNAIELMRIVIKDKNNGYGKNAISLILKWCFEVQNAHRLWLDVREDNLRAQNIYEKLGFKREGLLRECIKNGDNYLSIIIMSLLADEYKGVKKYAV